MKTKEEIKKEFEVYRPNRYDNERERLAHDDGFMDALKWVIDTPSEEKPTEAVEKQVIEKDTSIGTYNFMYDENWAKKEEVKNTVTKDKQIYVNQKFADNSVFGDCCVFIQCEFGTSCKFGGGCEFGSCCRFGIGCEFGK